MTPFLASDPQGSATTLDLWTPQGPFLQYRSQNGWALGLEYPKILKWKQSKRENELATAWDVGFSGKYPGSVCSSVSLNTLGSC